MVFDDAFEILYCSECGSNALQKLVPTWQWQNVLPDGEVRWEYLEDDPEAGAISYWCEQCNEDCSPRQYKNLTEEVRNNIRWQTIISD